MSNLCHKNGCNSLRAKRCSACGGVCYCSVECQKEDWKVHKLSYLDMKKLPTTFQSMSQIKRVNEKGDLLFKILVEKERFDEAIILLKTHLAFLEKQYGVQVKEESAWKRSNGDLVDYRILIEIKHRMTLMYSIKCDYETERVIALEARQMLEHRDKSEEATLLLLAENEGIISTNYRNRDKLAEADHHCELRLKYARLVKGEERIDCECSALQSYASLRGQQNRFPESVKFCEEAYVILSEAFGPVHPEVQDAAQHLMEYLTSNKVFSRADDYCRTNYENLTDPRNGMDQKSREVAEGMLQLAEIWLRKTSLKDKKADFALGEEAENLARKACQIMMTNYDDPISNYSRIFCEVLLKREKYTDETRIVLETSSSRVQESPRQ